MTPETIEVPADAATTEAKPGIPAAPEAKKPPRSVVNDAVAAVAMPLSPARLRLNKLRAQGETKPLTELVAIMHGEECFVRRMTYPAIMGIFRDAVRGLDNLDNGLLLTNPEHRAALVSSAIFHCAYADKEATKTYFGSVAEARAWAELEDERVSLAVGDLFAKAVELNPSILK
jgi:hypothetical protein